jgi:elongation factor P--(R)-beta-lysine ligase
MKRLLAAGSGSIYQMCKAFRNGERGRWHNPEFTILEWYRLGFDMPALIEECLLLLGGLLASAFPSLTLERVAYSDVFFQYTGLDALQFDLAAYRAFAEAEGLAEAYALCGEQPELWLDLLFSHCVQPQMQAERIYAVYHYPAIQSSLARVSAVDSRLAERFELFFNGVELGNGFFELADATEQERRFDNEIAYRRQCGMPQATKDNRLLAALAAGLPDCSGVAIGLDRLLMLLTGATHIDQVLAFPLDSA